VTTYEVTRSVFTDQPWAVYVHEDGEHVNTLYFSRLDEAERWIAFARSPVSDEPEVNPT
jgi:hypothetical protein